VAALVLLAEARELRPPAGQKADGQRSPGVWPKQQQSLAQLLQAASVEKLVEELARLLFSHDNVVTQGHAPILSRAQQQAALAAADAEQARGQNGQPFVGRQGRRFGRAVADSPVGHKAIVVVALGPPERVVDPQGNEQDGDHHPRRPRHDPTYEQGHNGQPADQGAEPDAQQRAPVQPVGQSVHAAKVGVVGAVQGRKGVHRAYCRRSRGGCHRSSGPLGRRAMPTRWMRRSAGSRSSTAAIARNIGREKAR
jgi:hypothetical protein